MKLKKFIAFLTVAVICFCMMPEMIFALQSGSQTKEATARGAASGILSNGSLLEKTPKGSKAGANYDHKNDAKIIAAMEDLQDEIKTAGYGLTKDNLSKVMAELLNTNPQIFYMQTYHYYYNNKNEVIKISFQYEDAKANIRKKQAELKSAEKKAMENLDTKAMTDEEVALALHDYLASNIVYPYDDLKSGALEQSAYTMYGALVKSEAVCQGYALAYQYLLQQCGIPCGVAASNNANHAWNVVRIKDNWYHADVTFDDPVYDNLGRAKHNYFLISTNTLLSKDSKRSDYVTVTKSSTPYKNAANQSFEKGFWNNSDSAMYYYGGNWYYPDKASLTIVKYDYRSKKSEAILKDQQTWPVWGNENAYWQGNYSRIVGSGSSLYYSAPTKIYKLDLTSKKTSTAFSPDAIKGYLYGLGKKEGFLSYVISTNPNTSAPEKVLKTNIRIETKTPAVSAKKSQVIKSADKYVKAYGSKPFQLNAVTNGDGALTYSSNNTNVAAVNGKGNVTIKGPGTAAIKIKAAETANYKAATKTILLTVNPKRVVSLKLKTGKKKMTVSWKRDAKASGYQVTYALNKKFSKSRKTVAVNNNRNTKKIITKLKSKKTYHVKVRAYKVVGGKKLYGAYCSAKSVKIK